MIWPGAANPKARSPGPAGKAAGRHGAAAWLLAGAVWAVLVVLTLALWLAETRANRGGPGRSPALVLWGGLTISVLMSAAVLQALLHRAKAQEQAQRHLEAIESLNAISAAIGLQIGSGTALDELARAGGRLLGMSLSGVCLVDASRRTLEVIAAAGDMPADFPRHYNLDDVPASDYCITTNTLLFEGDIRKITRPYSLDAVRLYGTVALVLIPLQSETRPIGLLTFSSAEPRHFTDIDRRIGELLGSQASVILANTRLLEQTRRDAEAKTALLRELNHRVKNNLSGIVALLGLNVPKMPPDVRAWLDRATDRIRAMASAHQLFTGEIERVSLESLVGQTLSALAVVKPHGVNIRTELDGVGLTLATEQGVGLAMVLHEVCYNALVHGLSAGGMLSIRARRGTIAAASSSAAESVIIEVEDDGVGCCPEGQPRERCPSQGPQAGGTGYGLELVEGLVRRELKGRFLLRPRAGGGTLATVEFPAGRG